jgi:DNA-binding response OmpR family regulator
LLNGSVTTLTTARRERFRGFLHGILTVLAQTPESGGLASRAVPVRTVVVVEDEPAIAQAVAARLRAEGHAVEVAGDGPSGVELCRRLRPDLVILDVMLPGFDGLEACRRIQAEASGSGPMVLMLTARDTETDVVVGLGLGADDYVTKPFSARELVARIAALLRRADRAAEAAGDAPIVSGELELDAAGRRVRVAGDEVRLTPTEFDLLLHLARNPGIVFSRERLLLEVWGYADGVGERTVDTQIAGLRRKIGARWIRTAHGRGYAFEGDA